MNVRKIITPQIKFMPSRRMQQTNPNYANSIKFRPSKNIYHYDYSILKHDSQKQNVDTFVKEADQCSIEELKSQVNICDFATVDEKTGKIHLLPLNGVF